MPRVTNRPNLYLVGGFSFQVWCHSIDFFSAPFGAGTQIVCLFVCSLFFLGFALSLLKMGGKRGWSGEGDGILGVRHLYRDAHDMGTHTHICTHTQTISLITSDREWAKGNSYSHGHFHCGAPLAICPIYAFNTHMNTYTHTPTYKPHTSVNTNTHSNELVHIHAWVCRETAAERTHKHRHMCAQDTDSSDTYGANEIPLSVALSFPVIQHHGGNYMCGNRDKTDTFAFSHCLSCRAHPHIHMHAGAHTHAHTHRLEWCQTPGHRPCESFNWMCVLTG